MWPEALSDSQKIGIRGFYLFIYLLLLLLKMVGGDN
jgi:hypothetical protein